MFLRRPILASDTAAVGRFYSVGISGAALFNKTTPLPINIRAFPNHKGSAENSQLRDRNHLRVERDDPYLRLGGDLSNTSPLASRASTASWSRGEGVDSSSKTSRGVEHYSSWRRSRTQNPTFPCVLEEASNTSPLAKRPSKWQ